MVGFFAAAETRRAEKDDGVLDLFAAKPRQRLQVLRNDADEASVGAIQEAGVFIGQRRAR